MYSSPLSLLTVLSLAVLSHAQASSDIASFYPPPGPPPPVVVNTTTINETVIYTCPPIPTIFINVTQYVPVTDITTDTTTASYWNTTTQPITIYQTVISTIVLTSTEIVTETTTTVSPTTATETSTTVTSTTETETSITVSPTTATETSITVSPTTATETSVTISPTTATETSTTISPTTATATEELLLSTITQRVTSVTLCPTRLVNPTYTAPGPYPTDWTWGCPPGWLCRPTRENCNFEAGIPDQNFLCAPNQCVPAQVLPVPLPTWDQTIYGNSTPALNPGLTVQALDDYFNINPLEFGLTYEIFVIEETITLTSTTIRPPSPTIGARQAQTSVPGVCYPWCNNCLLEAQANGKTPELCVPGSAFETALEQCEQCIEVHRSDNSGSFVQIAPQFQQFLDYCDQFTTVVVTTSLTTTTTNSAGSTFSTFSSELSTTVTTRSSPTTSVPTGPPTSVTTIVATTETTSLLPSTTVATVVTTSYSETTVTGDDWSQVTIILPLGNNSTTTVYGDTLTGGATLVLPLAQATFSYTTTATGSISLGASAQTTSLADASASAISSIPPTTSAAEPSQFSGGASSGKGLAENLRWWTVMIGTLIPLMFALIL